MRRLYGVTHVDDEELPVNSKKSKKEINKQNETKPHNIK